MKPSFRIFRPGVSFLALIMGACVGPAPTTPDLPATEISPPPIAETDPAPLATAAPHASWTGLRGETFGYGIAIPCWWIVVPAPPQGIISTMTIQSFDEAYFLANSTRGVWTGGDYPEGAIKMDFTAITEIDSSFSLLDAVRPLLENDLQELVSNDEIQIGRHFALLVHLRSRLHPEEVAQLHAYRLGPEVVLMVSAYPDRALSTPDVQGILASLALTSEEAVDLPTHPPSPPLIDIPEGCSGP